MTDLASARSLDELKDIYRKLAATYHPDKGGCLSTMQRINGTYRNLRQRFLKAANDNGIDRRGFQHVQIGTRLYINRTESEVLEVNATEFRAVALGRNRQAWFCKATGVGRNPRLRASFTPRQP